ncbi:MAG: hypothetical protein NTU51_04740 [Bacteroidetes bacterium]|nr:hypothetical protein [Bacteroidota bacterium]
MRDKENTNSAGNDLLNPETCNCDGNCCPPKKKRIYPKLIFSFVMLAALGIIFFKLFSHSAAAPATNKQVFHDPNKPVWSDSTGAKTCDTTKGSSCCSK